NPAAPTYLFRRGDERNPDKDHPLLPGVPAVLGGELSIQPVSFTDSALVKILETAAVELLAVARKERMETQAALKAARAAKPVDAAKVALAKQKHEVA